MLQLPLLLCVLEAQPITRATRDRAENVMRDAFDGTPAPSRASDNDGNTTDLNATRNEVDAASCNGLVKLLVETLPRVPPCRFFMVPLDGGGAAFSNLALGETLRVDPPLPPPMVTRLDGLLGPKVVDPGSGTLSDRIVRLAPPAPFQTVLVSSDWMRVARGAEATAGAGNVFTTDMAVLHVTQIRRGNAAAQYTAAAPSGGGADDAAVVVVRSAAQWRERRWRALDGAFSGLRPRLAPAGTSVGNGGGLRTGLHDGPVALTEPPTVLGVTRDVGLRRARSESSQPIVPAAASVVGVERRADTVVVSNPTPDPRKPIKLLGLAGPLHATPSAGDGSGPWRFRLPVRALLDGSAEPSVVTVAHAWLEAQMRLSGAEPSDVAAADAYTYQRDIFPLVFGPRRAEHAASGQPLPSRWTERLERLQRAISLLGASGDGADPLQMVPGPDGTLELVPPC